MIFDQLRDSLGFKGWEFLGSNLREQLCFFREAGHKVGSPSILVDDILHAVENEAANPFQRE